MPSPKKGPSLFSFVSPEKGNLMVLSYFESLKRFNKEKSTMNFFVKLVSRAQKSIKRYLGELS
jgi:hypothetical protein